MVKKPTKGRRTEMYENKGYEALKRRHWRHW